MFKYLYWLLSNATKAKLNILNHLIIATNNYVNVY